MVFRLKRCGRIAVLSLAVLFAAWIIGNLLVDVKFDGNEAHRYRHPPAGGAPDLRAVFENFPAAHGGPARLELLDNNSAAWAARWRLLAEARDSLDISYFILDSDIFGISFLGHIMQKAREGTKIRILLDAIGTTLSREIRGNDYLDALAATGNVTVKIYRPYVFRLRDAFLTLNPFAITVSDHDKVLIADGGRALIGGRNIGQDYLAEPEDYDRAFRDADVLLSGKSIGAELGRIFDAGFESARARDVGREAIDVKHSGDDLLLAYQSMDAWLRSKRIPVKTASAIRDKGLSWLDDLEKLPRLKGALKQAALRPISAEVRLLDSRPRLMKTDDPITTGLALLARSARREIFIQSPYLILSRKSLSVFEEAAGRGVNITILTNSPVSTDNPLSQAFFLEQWPRIMARVPTLRLFVAGDTHNIHGKLAVIDGELALIGTYNLDALSMGFNGELMAAVWSKEFSIRMLDRPRRLIAEGQPVIYEYRIVLNEKGKPRFNRDGNAVIAFGPEHHSSPDQWKKVQWYRKFVHLAEMMPGTSELLWE